LQNSQLFLVFFIQLEIWLLPVPIVRLGTFGPRPIMDIIKSLVQLLFASHLFSVHCVLKIVWLPFDITWGDHVISRVIGQDNVIVIPGLAIKLNLYHIFQLWRLLICSSDA
jgi:hypothetical protein